MIIAICVAVGPAVLEYTRRLNGWPTGLVFTAQARTSSKVTSEQQRKIEAMAEPSSSPPPGEDVRAIYLSLPPPY